LHIIANRISTIPPDDVLVVTRLRTRMTLVEDLKSTAERLTGYRRPRASFAWRLPPIRAASFLLRAEKNASWLT
jgi:hypothetical protein